MIALGGVAASACAPGPSGAAPPMMAAQAKPEENARELDLSGSDDQLRAQAEARSEALKRSQEKEEQSEDRRDAERHIQQAHGAGDSDEVVIARVVASHASNVQKCYDDLLAKSPASEGTVKVRVAIDVSGRVRDAKIVATTIDSPALSTCILHEVSTWTFPKLAEGAASITYPYVFSKS